MAIAYVEHPITKEEKKEYLKSFDKVLDIRFAPERVSDNDGVFRKESKKTSKKKASLKSDS